MLNAASACCLIQTGRVNDLDTLRLSGNRREKGLLFELLGEDYLRLVFGATRVWQESPDLGVDRFFIDRDGRVGAAQMKAYSPSQAVSMRDVTQFVEAAAARSGVDYLILLTTGRVSRHAQKVLDRHGIAAHTYDELVEQNCWALRVPPSPPPRFALRDYQTLAVERAQQTAALGQVIMPTGVGKTLVQAELARGYSSVLVLVPSMELVRQTCRTLRRQIPDRSVLAVYSGSAPEVVGIPVEVATRPEQVANFVEEAHQHVIVATYHAAPVLVPLQRDSHQFDLIVYDEAHRTAGPGASDALFKATLNLDKFHAERRRFFTATPRIHSPVVRHRLLDAGHPAYSMDDEAVYGRRLFTMSLADAVSDGWLCPFEIVVGVVSDPEVRTWIESNRWITNLTDPKGNLFSTEDLAGALFVLRQAHRGDGRRIISFHSRVVSAQRSAELFQMIGRNGKVPVESVAVDSASSAAARSRAISMLSAEDDHISVVCNVNLFGEGIDVPGLDAVVFFDPKRSPISVTQAIGRALRPSQGKKKAYVILPIFVGEAASAEDCLERSKWDNVFRVASALRDLGVIVSGGPELTFAERSGRITSTTGPVTIAIESESFDVTLFATALDSVFVHGTWRKVLSAASSLTSGEYKTWVEGEASVIVASNPDLTTEQVSELLIRSLPSD